FATCVVAAFALVHSSVPRTHRVHVVTDVVPLRVYLAEQIREEAAHHHLDLVPSAKQHGSLEVLEELDAPNEHKLALVPGGVKARDYPRVRLVATLATEPLHVLIRPGLAAGGFSALRGKRIALGPPTTASHHLAREVLAFAGLEPTTRPGPGGYVLV